MMVAKIAETTAELEQRPWLLHRSYKPPKWRLSESQRRMLLERYDGRTETIDALMRHFPGVPRWRVKRWATELGLSYKKAPPWTADELAYLREHLGVVRAEKIAKQLGRTVTAVQVKAKRLHISYRLSEGYTMRGLCEGLGVDHHKVEQWLDHGWIMAGSWLDHGWIMAGSWLVTWRAAWERARGLARRHLAFHRPQHL